MSSTHDASITTQTDTLLVSLYSCRINSWFLFRQKPYFAQLPFVILASVFMLPFYLVDCLWTDWGTWSSCSPTCHDADGYRMSSRTKEREVDNGGTACEGLDTRLEPCSIDPCPGMEASSNS